MSRYVYPGQMGNRRRPKRSFKHRFLYLEGWMTWILVFVVFFALALLGSVGCASLTSQHKAESVLKNVGFSNIHNAKKSWFLIELKGCGRDDSALYTFSATNPIGRSVHVSVCEGFFKGATIRGVE